MAVVTGFIYGIFYKHFFAAAAMGLMAITTPQQAALHRMSRRALELRALLLMTGKTDGCLIIGRQYGVLGDMNLMAVVTG